MTKETSKVGTDAAKERVRLLLKKVNWKRRDETQVKEKRRKHWKKNSSRDGKDATWSVEEPKDIDDSIVTPVNESKTTKK